MILVAILFGAYCLRYSAMKTGITSPSSVYIAFITLSLALLEWGELLWLEYGKINLGTTFPFEEYSDVSVRIGLLYLSILAGAFISIVHIDTAEGGIADPQPVQPNQPSRR